MLITQGTFSSILTFENKAYSMAKNYFSQLEKSWNPHEIFTKYRLRQSMCLVWRASVLILLYSIAHRVPSIVFSTCYSDYYAIPVVFSWLWEDFEVCKPYTHIFKNHKWHHCNLKFSQGFQALEQYHWRTMVSPGGFGFFLACLDLYPFKYLIIIIVGLEITWIKLFQQTQFCLKIRK